MMERDATYGFYESNGLSDGGKYHRKFEGCPTVDWTDKRLARITRLRLLSDPGFPLWDVSYVHGKLKDGTLCRVEVPFDQIPKGKGFRAFILKWARKEGVYAKGLGLMDEDTYSKLC